MVEFAVRKAPLESREERKARAVMPRVLSVLDPESTPKDGIPASQIRTRINALPNTRDFEPVGLKTITAALAIMQETGEVTIAKQDLDPDSLSKRNEPTMQNFYIVPQEETTEEPEAETAPFPIDSMGFGDRIPGFRQSWEAAQKS